MGMSVQEAAVLFANTMAASINSAISEVAGVDVMWFRVMPDKRNQDVIFQSYTLYGVNDCPLEFKAVYSDTGYDDAAITYNIMGLEYSVPLTLEIAVNTWYKITNNDGTIPQRGDIVFIPITKKLVEVVSMTPIKAIGGQITTFKVNCSAYKPTRSRIVGENLRESIEGSTVNLDSLFGKDIDDTIKNVVDDKQLSMFTSTSKDSHKDVAKYTLTEGLTTRKIMRNIITGDIRADGHIVARNYYDMDIPEDDVIKYIHKPDTFTADDERCLSCWVNIKEYPRYTNVREISTDKDSKGNPTGNYIYIRAYTGKRLEAGTDVVLERGNIIICGTVDDSEEYRIKVHPKVIRGLNASIRNWTSLTGYIIRKDNVINLLTCESETMPLDINIKANSYISVKFGDKEVLVQLSLKLKCNKWYGMIINLGKTMSVDVFEAEPELRTICSAQDIKNPYWTENTLSYRIRKSSSFMTNIRLYDVSNNELDKQITDLVSYLTPYDSHAIINDSADTPLNKPYVGQQR